MSQFRLSSLTHLGTESNDFLIVGHQATVATDVLVLLHLFQVIIEKKHLATVLCRLAHQLQPGLVVLAGIERTDIPLQACSDHAVQRPLAMHHILKQIIARITVEALGEDAQARHQRCIKGFLLGVGQTQLGIDDFQFRAL